MKFAEMCESASFSTRLPFQMSMTLGATNRWIRKIELTINYRQSGKKICEIHFQEE